MNHFQEGSIVLKRIEESGHQAYFVGGCVRDFILNRPIKDIDIATSASPKQIQTIFPKVIPIGIKHGTVIVRFNHISYEITTFRLEGNYSDQRHPDHVEFIDNIEEDLRRRDFTMNALAMDRFGDIIDLFNGKEDLQRKVIQTVGNGHDRFTEDPLRIIRALRFSSQLGFIIEQGTLRSMVEVKKQIKNIAIERITNEITQLFAGSYVQCGIHYLKITGIYKHLPIMVEYPYIMDQIPTSLKPFSTFGETIALLHHIEPKISILEWSQAWKCSNKIKQEATKLTEALYYFKTYGLDAWFVYQLPENFHKGFIRLIHNLNLQKQCNLEDMEQIERKLSITSRHELAVNGSDLTAIYSHIKPGPWIHKTLEKLEKEVVFNRLKNTKSDLKEWIKCNPPVIN